MKIITLLLILFGLTLGLLAGIKEAKADSYCQNFKKIDEVARIKSGESVEKTDFILVSKDRHKLYLLFKGKVIREYAVSFGFGFKNGAKYKEGDGRTPEGLYKINFKNKLSQYHMSLRLSYPEKKDLVQAKMLKINPGAHIMIHGLPENMAGMPASIQSIHTFMDWTQGCIAVTDHEIEEIFSLAREETPVLICPLSKSRP